MQFLPLHYPEVSLTEENSIIDISKIKKAIPTFLLIYYIFLREGRGNAHLTGNYKRIGDVVLHNFDSVTTEYYLRYVDTHGLLLEKLERVLCDPNRYIQLWNLLIKFRLTEKATKN